MVSTRKLLLSALTGAVALLSAAALNAQTPATICKDGTTSASSGRGACSGHGGVGRKAVSHQKRVAKSSAKAEAKADKNQAKAEAKIDKSEAKENKAAKASATARAKANTGSAAVGSGAAEDNNAAGAIARCKDGLYSHAKNRRGACSRHGGVASWI